MRDVFYGALFILGLVKILLIFDGIKYKLKLKTYVVLKIEY